MAINPASYNETMKTIQAAIQEWDKAVLEGSRVNGLLFSSLEVHIYNRLKEKNLLKKEE